MTEVRRFSLVKPTLQTRYHIDFDWWSQRDSDWRVYLQNLLCEEHRKAFSDFHDSGTVDWVDPETAEVQKVDGLQHILISHCAKQPGFITDRTALVDAVFRVFLANGNDPMSPLELAERLNRQPVIILKTLSGTQVYRGLRPLLETQSAPAK
ncbi:MAG: hypothetical protein EHM70_05110 [Chloroflexota bacterium]|nr:MAG: hypothetical protein EHM70_05110 [Chloroflexota bacterium]